MGPQHLGCLEQREEPNFWTALGWDPCLTSYATLDESSPHSEPLLLPWQVGESPSHWEGSRIQEKTMGVRRQVRLTSIPLSTADGGEDSRPHQLTDLPSYESLPMLPSQIRGKPGSSRRSAQNSPLPSSRTSKQACTVVEGHGHSPRESGNASLGLSRQTDAARHVTWASVFLCQVFIALMVIRD